MARKKKKRNVLTMLLLLVGILVVFALVAKFSGWIGKEKAVKISVDKVAKRDIVEKVTASGKVQPEAEIIISSDVSGEIISVLVEEGDSVKQGQLLFKIRPDNIQALVESATATVQARQANLAQAKADLAREKAQLMQSQVDFERNQDLYDQKVVSQADFQTSQTNYEVAKERVSSAEQNVEAARYNLNNSQANLRQNMDNLSRTEIYAPVNGIVSQLNVEKGEKVVGTGQMAGTEMLTIADLSNMEVQVDVNENDIIRVRKGQPVDIEVDSYSGTGRMFSGVVTEIANTANATATADAVTEFEVKIRILRESFEDLINKDGNRFPFRPGMTATVEVITDRKEGILSVPISAVTTRQTPGNSEGGSSRGQARPASNVADEEKKTGVNRDPIQEIVYVYNKKEETVSIQEVETGISDFENIEIKSGLKAGQQIITGPFLTISRGLKEGQKVEIEKPNEGRRRDRG